MSVENRSSKIPLNYYPIQYRLNYYSRTYSGEWLYMNGYCDSKSVKQIIKYSINLVQISFQRKWCSFRKRQSNRVFNDDPITVYTLFDKRHSVWEMLNLNPSVSKLSRVNNRKLLTSKNLSKRPGFWLELWKFRCFLSSINCTPISTVDSFSCFICSTFFLKKSSLKNIIKSDFWHFEFYSLKRQKTNRSLLYGTF